MANDEKKPAPSPQVRGLAAAQALAEDPKIGEMAARFAHRANGGYLHGEVGLAFARTDLGSMRKLAEEATADGVGDDDSTPFGAAVWLREKLAPKKS